MQIGSIAIKNHSATLNIIKFHNNFCNFKFIIYMKYLHPI